MPPRKRTRGDEGRESVAKRIARPGRTKVGEKEAKKDRMATQTVEKSENGPVKEKAGKAEAKDEGAGRRGEEDGERGMRYWLMKAEPESRIEKGKDVKFSIDDLAACSGPAGWDGVRNYGARNNLTSMKTGDLAFFYHSNCKIPGIVGIMQIAREATIDETAFNPKEPYYDPKSSRDNPKWYLVHVSFVRKLVRPINLQELKSHAGSALKDMPLLKMGRLSVSPVPKDCWDFILKLENEPVGANEE